MERSPRSLFASYLADESLARINAVSLHDNGSNLVSAPDLVVALLEDLLGGAVTGGVRRLEDLLIVGVHVIVDGLDASGGNFLGDLAGDALGGVKESVLRRHPLLLVPPVKPLDDGVDGS